VLVDRLELAEDGALILVRVVGSHFLWRMVRRLVGVLSAVGQGHLDARDVTSMLESESDLPGKLTAPASGLFLESVIYRGDSAPGPLRAVADVSGRR